jgi:hydroxyacylglutathione hydrolase
MTRLYVEQFLSGKDIARSNPAAAQMENFAYLVGDLDAGVCFAVDPSWGPMDLVEIAAKKGLKVQGVLATHSHADHVGGSLWGYPVPGVARLVAELGLVVHVHRLDADSLAHQTRIPASSVVPHDDGAVVAIGGVAAKLHHTPGHTPGSACYEVEGNVFTGDTLFLQGCGRVDLPGGDPAEMFRSLHQRMVSWPGSLLVLPGHDYGGARATLDEIRRTNPALRMKDPTAWERENR